MLGGWSEGSETAVESLEISVPGHGALVVPALVAAPAVVVEVLADRYPTRRWSASLRWMQGATALSIDAIVAGMALPSLETTGLRWRAGWQLVELPALEERLSELSALVPPVVLAGGTRDVRAIVAELADSACRRALAGTRWRPPLPRSRNATVVAVRRFATALAEPDGVFVGDSARHEAVFATLGSALSQIRSRAEGSVAIRCRGRLTPGDEGDPWRLAFEVVAADDPTRIVAWSDVWEESSAARELVDGGSLAPVRRYLTDMAIRLAALVPGLDRLDDDVTLGALDLDIDEVAVLLGDGLGLCEQAGAPVLVPKSLVSSNPRLTGTVSTPTDLGGVAAGLGAALVEVDWRLALGDREMTEAEIRELAESKSGLVRLRGEWVRVDAAGARATLAELAERQRTSSQLTPGELMRVVATAGLQERVEVVARDGAHASASDWLDDLLAGLPDDRLAESAEPAGFYGTLRPYQRRALGWMQFLARLGLGGCLADDMGLGKTPTTLAHLAGRVGRGPSLVVCPLSVVHNWEAEAARFVPAMRVLIAHGQSRPSGSDMLEAVRRTDLVITTYGTVARDIDTLSAVEWDLVICDEAQAIKNHQTNAAQAFRELRGAQKLALTGTPVENRLAELWAILDAVNPGMLGGITWFREHLATPIEVDDDERALDSLRRITGPFVLRRTKSDRSLVPDLPEKIEQLAWATLTPEQAGLYQAVLDDFLDDADRTDGMKRRGLVLATLTRLKQICNHPAHFLDDGSSLAGRSGKLARFDELVDELIDAGERALVFTQYRKMGELLVSHLADRLGEAPPFLHGGVTRRRREQMIDEFQSGAGAPLQLVSLRAGGTGLNLTSASRVIHYDRWWNPAVEDQATDRAWRIGQSRTVFVHKLVCQGTLEERIDGLLAEKKELAERAVGAGEAWITEMDTGALGELLRLDPDAVGEF